MPAKLLHVGFAAAIVVATGGAWAAEEGHKPHVHGESKMNLALEGDIVEIELESPGFDIVGFESMPKTAEQRASVKRAVAALENGEALFRFTGGADCKLQEAEVETPLAEAEGHAGDDHAEEEEHSEFHAHYRFRCARPGRLKSLEILVFDAFRSMREIELGAILPGGQRARTLTPDGNRFDF